MTSTQHRSRAFLLLGSGLALLVVGGLWLRPKTPPRPDPLPQATSADLPVTRPAAEPVLAPPRTYLELIRRNYPAFPTTRPLEESLGLQYAGHFAFPEPVHLDATGRLWITRADADPTETILPKAAEESTILTRERPLFVHWISDENGERPHLVCLNSKGDGYELVTAYDRLPLGQGLTYDWARARSWDEKIVVPTDTGVSILTIGRRVAESVSPPLATPGEPHAPVQITFSGGPLAWIPPQPGHPGSQGAVRWTGNAWTTLTPEHGWPAGLLHLIPLLDGSILQLLASQDGLVTLRIVPLDPMNPDEEKRIASLVAQLSDSDPSKRNLAYQSLTRYGSGLWPIAEKLMPRESPETQARLKDLLKTKMNPLLGGMQLVDGKMRVISRYPDGGVLFYAAGGVQTPRGDEPPQTIAPAWLSALPGDSIRLLHPDLVQDLNPDKVHLTPCLAEWIVADPVRGPQRFLGGDLIPLLRKSERQYTQFVGIARGGRYVFRNPQTAPATQSTSRPLSPMPLACDGVALVIDPRLPDPKPRLPVWLIEYPNTATVGWDKNHWPAAKQRSGWALGAKEWRVLDEATESFYSSPDQAPGWPPLPPSHPVRTAATQPAGPTSTPTLRLDDKPLLVDAEGTYYFDGRNSLIAIRPDGTRLDWLLPPQATGQGDTHLIRTPDGLLFLFNQPGRVLRIRPTPGSRQPFVLEATFTHRIPNAEHPARIWLDPFGRIVIAYEGHRLAILFPQGYIPPAMVSLIPADDQEDWFDD